MAQQDWVAREIGPWIESVERLDRWRREARACRLGEHTVAELRDLLQTLASRRTAVPRDMAVPQDPLARAFAPSGSQAKLLAWRARRGALLRLAVWRVLEALHAASGPRAEPQVGPRDGAAQGSAHGGPAPDAMTALQEAMAHAALRVPPGLSPALDCAGETKAQQFFGGCVHAILRKLAERHPGHAAWLERLHAARYEVASVAGAQAWSEAWTVGIAANYLNCLRAKARGDLARAMALVWSDKSTRIHAADKLLLLPARERHLHVDLWTDLVQAQALDHQDCRFAAPSPWHRVHLKMHDLGVSEQSEDGGATKVDRGIGVDLLHLPVFADRARLALQAMQAGPGAAWPIAAAAKTIVVDLPDLAPGQEANLRLVLRLSAAPGDDGPRRPGLPQTFAAPALDAQQDELYRQWAVREGGVARRLPAAELDWQAASGEHSNPGELGEGHGQAGDLGSAALWRAASAAGDAPQWLDVALVVRRHGQWTLRPLDVHARIVGGELHCGLSLDADAAADSSEVASEAGVLRRAMHDPARNCWVASGAGLGAFVMIGVDLDAADAANGA